MIMTDKTEVSGIESAMRGMRNPMNSWVSGDTFGGRPYVIEELSSGIKTEIDAPNIGCNDMELALRLCRRGSEHRKFLRFIHVTVDITAPLYWWKQADTYKFVDTNSCSTMHKLTSRKLNPSDFSCDSVDSSWMGSYVGVMNTKIDIINELKKQKMDGWKEHERSLFQMLLDSYNQTRTVTLSYETLVSMCIQRKGHKLSEWNEFIGWAEKLPYLKTFVSASIGKDK